MEAVAAPFPCCLASVLLRADTAAVNRVHAQVAHVEEVVATLPFIGGVLREDASKTVRRGRNLALVTPLCASAVSPLPDTLARLA